MNTTDDTALRAGHIKEAAAERRHPDAARTRWEADEAMRRFRAGEPVDRDAIRAEAARHFGN